MPATLGISPNLTAYRSSFSDSHRVFLASGMKPDSTQPGLQEHREVSVACGAPDLGVSEKSCAVATGAIEIEVKAPNGPCMCAVDPAT